MNEIHLPAAGRRDPDPRGYFGDYGGCFVPETLATPVEELRQAYFEARADEGFRSELGRLLRDYAGRPTPLFEAARLSSAAGGARLLLKREDLAHTGAHKINNAVGQALLARRMGKTRVVAETGAGQHGVATAAACALARPARCEVYMGADDMVRQRAERRADAAAGRRDVAASRRAAGRSRTRSTRRCATGRRARATTHYLLGSALGPHPYPLMVREFQSVIGIGGARGSASSPPAGCPDVVVALRRRRQQRDRPVRRVRGRRVGAAGGCRGRRGRGSTPGATRRGSPPGSRPASSTARRPTSCRTPPGNIEPTHSISAGLDYAAVGPEHAWLRSTGRAEYVVGHRRRGAVRLPRPVAARGHPPGARVGARGGVCRAGGAADRAGGDRPGQPLGTRRQGRGDRRPRRRGERGTRVEGRVTWPRGSTRRLPPRGGRGARA